MNPSDSRRLPMTLIDSCLGLGLSPSRRVSQVPRSVFRCALPPITPAGPRIARAHCFIRGDRLHPIRETGRLHWCNEAESGLLSLRLAPSPKEGFDAKIAPDAASQATCQMGNYMVDSSHSTRLTRLGLAHRKARKELRKAKTAEPRKVRKEPLNCEMQGTALATKNTKGAKGTAQGKNCGTSRVAEENPEVRIPSALLEPDMKISLIRLS